MPEKPLKRKREREAGSGERGLLEGLLGRVMLSDN